MPMSSGFYKAWSHTVWSEHSWKRKFPFSRTVRGLVRDWELGKCFCFCDSGSWFPRTAGSRSVQSRGLQTMRTVTLQLLQQLTIRSKDLQIELAVAKPGGAFPGSGAESSRKLDPYHAHGLQSRPSGVELLPTMPFINRLSALLTWLSVPCWLRPTGICEPGDSFKLAENPRKTTVITNFLICLLLKKLNLWLTDPTPSTRLLKLTGRWQYDGIMWLALRSVKSNNVDFLNQIRYFSIK